MLIEISRELKIAEAPDFFEHAIMARLTFENPQFAEAVERGRWTGNISPLVECWYRDEAGRLVVPRGFARQLCVMARKGGIPFELVDRRRTLTDVDFRFTGELRPFQGGAVEAVLSRDFGTLAAPTGSGKTCMALFCIAQRRQPALVVVHTRELAAQWVDRIETFLGIPADEVGLIGSGKKRIGERITVAMVQSLYKYAHEVKPYIGQMIVDECHRAPSRTFTEAVRAFDSHYMLGLSATPFRRDGLGRLIWWYLGDLVHEVDRAALVEQGHLCSIEVKTIETDFWTYRNASEEYSVVLKELCEDPARNALIAEGVARASRRNGSGIVLALSDRRAHIEKLQTLLNARHKRPAAILHGDMSAKARQKTIEDLNAGRYRVLLATGQLIGEGFDLPALSALFLATPIRFSGRVLQYLGRVLRPAQGKGHAMVVDYIDRNVPVLKASAAARKKIYQRLSAGGDE